MLPSFRIILHPCKKWPNENGNPTWWGRAGDDASVNSRPALLSRASWRIIYSRGPLWTLLGKVRLSDFNECIVCVSGVESDFHHFNFVRSENDKTKKNATWGQSWLLSRLKFWKGPWIIIPSWVVRHVRDAIVVHEWLNCAITNLVQTFDVSTLLFWFSFGRNCAQQSIMLRTVNGANYHERNMFAFVILM